MIADLTAPERLLSEAYPVGQPVDLRVGDPRLDDPAEHAAWGANRHRRGSADDAVVATRRPVLGDQARE